MKKPVKRICIHHVKEDERCRKCEWAIKQGKMTVREVFSKQRLWQLEQKSKDRCEICGGKKTKYPELARCLVCLSKDAKRWRKKNRRPARWMPGMPGRPRHIKGNPELNFARQREAHERRMRKGE